LLLQSPHPPRPPGNRLPSATPKLWEKTKIRRCSFFSSGCYGAAFQAPMIFSPLLFSRLPFCLLAAVVVFFSAFVFSKLFVSAAFYLAISFLISKFLSSVVLFCFCN
jgi:hypothetical protein